MVTIILFSFYFFLFNSMNSYHVKIGDLEMIMQSIILSNSQLILFFVQAFIFPAVVRTIQFIGKRSSRDGYRYGLCNYCVMRQYAGR